MEGRPQPPSAAFRGRVQWMTFPANVAGITGGVLAPYYGYLVFHFPPGSLTAFLLICGVMLVLGSGSGSAYQKWRLRGLDALGSGELPITRENLLAVVREVIAGPDVGLGLSLRMWLLMPAVAALALKLLRPEVPWTLVARIGFLGAIIGPLSSVQIYYLLVWRSRQMVKVIAAAGLSPADLLEVLPPTRRYLRSRFVAFAAMAFVTPSVLIADVSLSLSRQRLTHVVKIADLDQRRAVVEKMEQTAGTSVTVLFLLTTSLALATAYIAGRTLGQPLRELASDASRMAAGQLGRPQVIPAEDDVWVVAAAFITLVTYLVDVLAQLQRAGSRLSSASDQVFDTSRSQEDGAYKQASALDETSATTELLAWAAGQNAQTSSSVAELAEKTLVAAEVGEKSSQQFFAAMLQVRKDNLAVASAVEQLNSRVQQIGKIVEFIRGVADRSDLLAVNAELEGTKAGEVGRGFSLVAAEMRRLAEDVLRTTQEIEQLILEIRHGTVSAVQATQSGVEVTETGAQLAGEISASFRRVLELATRTSDSVKAITLATRQQQTGTGQLATTMAEALRATLESSDATRKMSAASEGLSGLAREIEVAVSRFNIDAPRGRAG